MKIIIHLIIYIIIQLSLVGCNSTYKSEANLTCMCILSPTSTAHDTYLIEVNGNGVIKTSFGCLPDTIEKIITKNEIIDTQHVILIEDIEKTKKYQLSVEDNTNLKEMIGHLSVKSVNNPFVEGWFWDAWMVILMVNDKQFVYEKNTNPNKDIDSIVNELIRLSPIPVSFNKLMGGKRLVQ